MIFTRMLNLERVCSILEFFAVHVFRKKNLRKKSVCITVLFVGRQVIKFGDLQVKGHEDQLTLNCSQRDTLFALLNYERV